jgi:hypothetical protein
MKTETLKRVLLGHVGVDSGQIMISDPCYVKDFNDSEDFNPARADERGNYPYSYNGSCGATLSDAMGGQLGAIHGVVSSTGYGDGCYEVWATIGDSAGWGRRVHKLEVIFIDDSIDENEDEDDDDNY